MCKYLLSAPCCSVCGGGECVWYLVVIRNKMNSFSRCSQADCNRRSSLVAYRLFNMFVKFFNAFFSVIILCPNANYSNYRYVVLFVTKFVLNLLAVLEYTATNVLSLTLSTLRVFSPPLHDDALLLSPATTPTTQPPRVYVAGDILSIVLTL